ncbi:anoctamin-10-like [Tachypleus tridentatus]|uniref:anoctamin-10-like n=1 Tax=Tachypleus tridentatus TaxID=6853 RepID=UPI003FD1BCE5
MESFDYCDSEGEDLEGIDTVDGQNFPGTLCVIVFQQKANQNTVNWLTDLIQQPRKAGGAGLLVKKQGNLVHISATDTRLLETAELMEIKKADKNGLLREFTLQDMDLFLHKGMNSSDLLTTSEKQRIIFHELENIRAVDKQFLFGYPGIKLYAGQSIVQVCQNNGIIKQVFPLHDEEDIRKLEACWYKSFFSSQPVEDIRRYFGEAVSFYFAFLDFYTWALVPPALIGILQLVLTGITLHTSAFFAVFNLLWVTIFLESWKRRSNELAYSWGTINTMVFQEHRSTFRGKYMGVDPVTGRHVPMYPPWKRYFKVYCISLPIVFLCLFLAILIMLLYFRIEKYVIQLYRDSEDPFSYAMTQLPGIVYTIIVFILNLGYRYFATHLTEWENHRTQTKFDNHRIVKLVLFEFVNNFLCLFYIAFYLKDLEMLRWQLALMLIINQLINQIQEAFLPLLVKYWQTTARRFSISSKFDEHTERVEEFEMWGKTEQALVEKDMVPYEGTYDDYLEMFIQFGYVFLFSSVYPLAAFWALLNNILEMKTDAFKLCKVYQRPIARPARGIGAWQKAFEVIGAVAVMTNCALLSMSPAVRSLAPTLSPTDWALVMVAAEHIIMAIKFTLVYLIPDVPEWVNLALQKIQYDAQRALKSEKKRKIRQVLRRLNTVCASKPIQNRRLLQKEQDVSLIS